MKEIKYILQGLLVLTTISCVNQEKKDEQQIKMTVTKYWEAVRKSDLQAYSKLIDNSEGYPGVIVGDLNFSS